MKDGERLTGCGKIYTLFNCSFSCQTLKCLKMKRLFFFLLFLFIYSPTFSQNFGNYFFGDKYSGYIGLTAKFDVERDGDKGGSDKLYFKVFKSIPSTPRVYTDDYDNLVNDISKYKNSSFIIESILDFNKKDLFEHEFGQYKIFKLKEKSTNQLIYYVYQVSNKEAHYLLTEFGKGGYDTSIESEIERSVDEFTGEIKINSPLLNPIGSFYKYIKKGKSSYYLSFRISSSGVYIGKGAYVLFTDGSKWSRPSEVVDVDYSDDKYQNSVFIMLSQADLDVFRKKIIKKIRVYIHDKAVSRLEGETFSTYVSIINKMK